MRDFQAQALRSGSSGNLYLFSYSGRQVILDCGVNGKQFATALHVAGIPEDRIRDLEGIVITHEHRDHIAGLGVVMRRYRLPIFLTAKTYAAAKPCLGHIDEDLVHIIEAGKPFCLGDMEITSFPLSHDAADPQGYTFETSCGKVALCTDTGLLTAAAKAALVGSDLVFIEANYEPGMLEAGPYPYPLKVRIRSDTGHLSNQTGAAICRRLLEQGTQHFVLSHLSQNNNYPRLAELVASQEISRDGARRDHDYTLAVADRFNNSPKISIERSIV